MNEHYTIDLHMHTQISDGKESPVEVVNKASEVGLKKICLADHNSLHPCYDKLREYAKTKGVEVLPFSGCEASVVYYEEDKPLFMFHMLVYGDDEAIRDERFVSAVSGYFDRSVEIAKKQYECLKKSGVDLSWDEIFIYDKDIAPIEKMDKVSEDHIAKHLAKKFGITMEEVRERYGEELSHPRYGAAENLLHMAKHADAVELIKLANELGLVTVVAHPRWIDAAFECDAHLATREGKGAMIRRLHEAGLDGIEVCHQLVHDEDKVFFTALAEELGLITTGGSDYHAEEDYGSHLTEFGVTEEGLKKLCDRIALKKATRAKI